MIDLDLPILEQTTCDDAGAYRPEEMVSGAPDLFEPSNPANPRLRAALINPQDRTSADGYRWTPPLGLGYIASVARLRGFHADIFDLSLEAGRPEDLARSTGLLDDYDVYGFSTYTETFGDTIALVRVIAAARPDALIVLGGYHASVAAEPVLRDFPEVDVVVLREGEEAFSGILDRVASKLGFDDIPGIVYRGGSGAIVTGPPNDLLVDQELLPYPVVDLRCGPLRALHLADPHSGLVRKTVSIVSSRGCPKRCTFCSIIILSPNWRARSVESLMEEIRFRYRQSPFGHIIFQDANFFVSPSRTLELSRALHEFNPAITWSGTATADQVGRHADVLREIGALNCWYLELGIESGNNNSLKRFNKRTTVAINERALKFLAASRINIGLDFIMFEPEMMFDDVMENFRFLHRNELFGYWPTDHLFSDLRLFPGTAFRDRHSREMGIESSIHVIPDPCYVDPSVGALVGVMHHYLSRYQGRTNREMKGLLALTNYFLYEAAGEARKYPELVDLLQRLQVGMVRLRHLPYTFLGSMLMRRDQLLAGGDFEEMIAGIDMSLESETHDECRALVNAILDICGDIGVDIPEEIASQPYRS